MWTKRTLQQTLKDRLSDVLFLVVSNREPYVHRIEGEELICERPASGLTIALDPVMRACGGLWVAHGSGNGDRQVVDANGHITVPTDNPAYTLRRVWLTKEEEDGYYYGFSNRALWPLCHIAYTRPSFDAREWAAYRTVNEKFARVVLEEVGERNAFVFIQDYHFALLPRLLRRPNIRVAQFWHIPWPNPEAFRICPWGAEILDGLLGNDLLGFHITFHCQNFLAAVERVVEAKVDYEHATVTRGGLNTKIRAFPISVDFEAIANLAKSPEVSAEMERLTRLHRLRGKLLVVGVDRIDYTKGILERFQAIARLLEGHPELQERVVFVEVGVPSRTRIAEYQRLNEEIDELVESINWKFQTDAWKPILYLRRNTSPITLQAWYGLATVGVVTSLHDGMNLVAKEFVASRIKEDGVLVLSQFTGAARQLTDAELVNPFAIDELAATLHRAMTMPLEEQQRRMRRLRAQVQERNIYRWAGEVLSELFQFEFQEA